MAAHNHQSVSRLPNNTADPGGPSAKKKSLPQFLSDSDGSDDSEDEEEQQLGFGYPDEEQEVDESPNTSLSSQSKIGGGDDEEDDMDEDFDDEGTGRMDRAMDMGQGRHDYQLRQNINRDTFEGSGFADPIRQGIMTQRRRVMRNSTSREREGGERGIRGRGRRSPSRRRVLEGKGEGKR